MKKLVIGLTLGVYLVTPGHAAVRDLTLDQRIAAQRSIEQVYWNHRIWPKENPRPKPPLSAVMSDSAIRMKVENYLRMSALLDTFWRQRLTGRQLQREISRMAQETKAPETLRELFTALDDDPFLIAECLARPTLSERLVESAFAGDERIHGPQRKRLASKLNGVQDLAALERVDGDHAEVTLILEDGAAPKRLPEDPADRAIHVTRKEWDREIESLAEGFGVLPAGSLSALPVGRASRLVDRGDHFIAFAVRAKDATSVTVVSVSWMKRSYGGWAREAAGSSMLVANAIAPPVLGYRTPALPLSSCTDDTWASTSLGANLPSARYYHTAIWTGSEMIVWGGVGGSGVVNTGGLYNPSTDSWAASSLTAGSGTDVPDARYLHAAVWTGSEMIVWGGVGGSGVVNTGGLYNPSTDSWAASSLTVGSGTDVPGARANHTAVWTGSEMIVWGGSNSSIHLDTGGRYDPTTDSWAASSLTAGSGTDVPGARAGHTAIWTGSEMIVWGGFDSLVVLDTGGRYNPTTDSWAASSLTAGSGANLPSACSYHTAVWTGSEMIVWGGQTVSVLLSTGGRYDPTTDLWATSSLTAGSGVNIPSGRKYHTAVWTGSEMIVWGGFDGSGGSDTGGRYDPTTDSWAASSLTAGSGANVPSARYGHTVVWTGSEMIVWGGITGSLGGGDEGGTYCAVACTPQTWYQDVDLDGHGNPGVTQSSCIQPAGYVAVGDDCNDADAAIQPGAIEVCNGMDDNCDGTVDNGGGALCDDGNACTDDVCGGTTGCIQTNNTNPCDDANPCTAGDACSSGVCSGTAVATFGTLGVSKPTLTGAEPDLNATISWGGNVTVKLIRGDLVSLRSTGGITNVDAGGCLVNGFASSTADNSVPGSGASYYLMKTAAASCIYLSGAFSEGLTDEKPGAGGDRDFDIAGDPDSCP